MEDKEILKLYCERNERAIVETSSKYGSYCKNIAMNILNNCEDAEECINDTYLNVWNTITPHIPSVFSAFLGKIIRNLSFNKYKYNKMLKRGGSEIELILDELAEIVSDNESVEDEILKNELLKMIESFLKTLSVEKKSIFIRRYWYSESISKIAEFYGRSENSVSVILNRIRKKLRKYLIERGYEL